MNMSQTDNDYSKATHSKGLPSKSNVPLDWRSSEIAEFVNRYLIECLSQKISTGWPHHMTKYEAYVRSACSEGFVSKEIFEKDMAIALYLVGYVSLSDFESTVQMLTDGATNEYVWIFVSYLLNNPNIPLCFALNQRVIEWYDKKKDILKSHLTRILSEPQPNEGHNKLWSKCSALLQDNKEIQKDIVVGNGRIYESQEEPPDQRCLYILPGDPHKEAYRVTTFANFPQTALGNPTLLASVGFYYTGYKDRVKCFSCEKYADNWQPDDNVKLAKWHKPDCHMSNRPLRSVDTGIAPSVSVYNNTARSQGTVVENPLPPRRTETLRNHQDSVAFGKPAYPFLRNEESRLEMFKHGWQSQTSATPEQLARAGFFYLGERDRVKCYYCNGELQKLDDKDEPWAEHAKQFPTCEFLLRTRGPNYIHQILSMFPNLPRHMLARQNELHASRIEVVSDQLNAYLEDLVQESLGVPDTSPKVYIEDQLQQALSSSGNTPLKRRPYYLALLYVYNMSLADFDEVLKVKKTDADLNPKLLMTMAFLLADPRVVERKLMCVITMSVEDHWFESKMESFEEFLSELSTSNPELKSLVETCRSILPRVK